MGWIQNCDRKPEFFGNYLVSDGKKFFHASYLQFPKSLEYNPDWIEENKIIDSLYGESLEFYYINEWLTVEVGNSEILFWNEPNFEPGYLSFIPAPPWYLQLWNKLKSWFSHWRWEIQRWKWKLKNYFS